MFLHLGMYPWSLNLEAPPNSPSRISRIFRKGEAVESERRARRKTEERSFMLVLGSSGTCDADTAREGLSGERGEETFIGAGQRVT